MAEWIFTNILNITNIWWIDIVVLEAQIFKHKHSFYFHVIEDNLVISLRQYI